MESAEPRALEEFIRGELRKAPFELTTVVPGETYVLFVDDAFLSDRSRSLVTSRRLLENIRTRARERFNVELDLAIRRTDQTEHIESAIHLLLTERLPGQLSLLHVSAVNARTFDVSAELTDGKATELQDRRSAIEAALADFARAYNVAFQNINVSIAGSAGRPLPLAILKELKVAAPAAVEEVHERLVKAGFDAPVEWLQARLDTLRRQGLVAWLSSNRYALTSTGLSAVPTSRSRDSSDVTRALALARRKW